jgi:signal peptidase I
MGSTCRAFPRDLLACLVAGALILVARASFADHYRVPSGSMEPTVAVGDHVCVNKLAYGLRVPESETYLIRGRAPQRGEVVVLASPADGEVLLKRVVAVPGDQVQVKGGHLVIDGSPVPVEGDRGGGGDTAIEALGAHPHRIDTTYGGGPDLPDTLVPEGKYLVLGDNRGNSRDGRSFGWVARDAILGRAAAVCVHDGTPVWNDL